MAKNGEITEDEFGIVFGLDKFLTLDNENKLSLFSLIGILHYRSLRAR